jgi:hypothetical protein
MSSREAQNQSPVGRSRTQSRLKKVSFLLLLLGLLFARDQIVYGQITASTLNGNITDSTGASVPGATITVKNIGTNLTRQATSDAQGRYSVSQLPPGTYTIWVVSNGFQKYLQTGIVLTVAQVATQNVALQIGNVESTVQVTAGAALINTTTAELSTVVNAESITQLPLNGRDPSSLVLLAPGTTNVLNTGGGALQSGFSFPTEQGASANGGRQGSTYYLLDGVPNMDTYLQLAAPFPNADATQEFRVISNNFDARYGFAPGAVVTIQTRSGVNAMHGGLFEFIRNDALNASNYFSHAKDTLKRNQFGGEIGGPIIRDKLFYFFNYQGTRSMSNGATNVAYTPTAAMLNGDFSAVQTELGAPFATVSGKPNQVNPALFSPAAVTIAKTGLPLGQVPATGQVTYATGNIINNFDEYTGKLDYVINQNQRLNVRSFIDYFNQPSGDVNGNILSVQSLPQYIEIMNEPMEYYNEVASHTWSINPKTANVFSAFWNQMSAHSFGQVNDSSGQPMCLSRYIKVNELPGSCYIEGLSVTDGFVSGYTEPSQELRTTFGILESVTRVVGQHTLVFGGDIFHQYAKQITQYPTQPLISFDGSVTGFGLADYLLGYVSSFYQGAGVVQGTTGWMFGLYAQDEYRLLPNVNVTAGIRWDPNTPPALAGGQGSAFHPGVQSRVFPNAPTGLVFPGDPGVDDAVMPTTYGYYEPRIGVAWQPSWLKNTSVHASFGLFEAPLSYSAYGHIPEVSPFLPTYSFNSTTNANGTITPISFQDPWASFPGTGGVSPFPPFSTVNTRPPTNSVFPGPTTVPAVFDNNYKNGITQSWNVAIEQQFGEDFALHLAYVGSESYHQVVVIDQNPGVFAANGARTKYPQFASILTYLSSGTASYNSLQAGIEKRLSHGLQLQSNFTWANAIDTAASGNISFGSILTNPFNLRYNRGTSALSVPIISVSNFVYTTPDLRGHESLVRYVLGSWEVSGIITAQSGSPFGISGGDGSNNSGALQYADRADVTGAPFQVRQGGRQHWLNQYFNPAAFQMNAPGTFGDSGANILRTPPIATADMAAIKNWTVERVGVQFRWEAFNVFNHPSFGTPSSDPSSGNFGQITTIGAILPRVMQGALKLSF